MLRLPLHWLGLAALVGTVAMGARLASSVPVAHPATPAAELRVLVDSVVRISGAEQTLVDAIANRMPSSDEWQAAIALHVSTSPSSLPVAGSYRLDGGSIVFVPDFPLDAGVPYDLVIELNRLRASLMLPWIPVNDRRTQRILLPAASVARRTIVTGLHPSVPVVPANLLRFYLHFSRPMREGDAAEHLQLVNDSGQVVAGAFLDPALELWDGSHRRLTVLFDPGRIKRGLRPNRELGPPLAEGRRYRLRVDPGWRDADGAPLAHGFSHDFVVGPAVRRALEPARWRITMPAAGTSDPILVRSPVLLDHAQVPRGMGVVDSTGARVPARATLDGDERTVRLVAGEAWAAGTHRVVVAPELEDVAGNTPTAAFDEDLMSPRH
jgi:hypothetical protein